MPLYTFRCSECGQVATAFRKIADRDHAPLCEGKDGAYIVLRVGHSMHRIVEAPVVHTDLPGYQSPIDGRWIEGRVARTEDMKRNNCRPWEGMETERREAIKRADEADRVFEKQTEAAVHETFNNMSAEKQRVLATAFD